MKIDIMHFGPIDKFSCDLDNDLIVTYGKNNIGKSYSMQVIYLLLKSFIGNAFIAQHVYKKFELIWYMIEEKGLEKEIQDFIDSGEDGRDVTEMVVHCVYGIFGEMLFPELISSCQNTFGNFEKVLEKNPVIKVDYLQYHFAVDLKREKITGSIKMKPILMKKTESDQCNLKDCGEYFEIGVISETKPSGEILAEKIMEMVSQCICSFGSFYENVYFLPASRSGIYSGMNAFGSIVAELSKKRAYFKQKIDFPGISEPIADYFISLSNIKLDRNENLNSCHAEVKEIEENILKGQVMFDKERNTLMYQPQNMAVSFSMTEVSSMVSEISPIAAFLKYIVAAQKDRKSIIFIEEPEAHLHPENQIALIGVFAKLICKNVKLVISTHSNYVFQKLNNLILGKKLDYRIYQPIILEEKENGSISRFLQMDELGAEDENFMDASGGLYYEREELIQQMNMEETE